MRNRFMTGCLLCTLVAWSGAGAVAAEVEKSTAPPIKREIIPGSELMTPQERERYRQRMRNAKTPQEQEKVRAEHTGQMRERARLRGLRLPETPAAGNGK